MSIIFSCFLEIIRCIQGHRCFYGARMSNKLTNETRNSFEHQSVCSNGSAHSALDPRRVCLLDRQGERSTPPREAGQTASFERVPPAAAVASREGGASQSKRTRRSRPWNVSMPTAVVASSSILKDWLFLDESAPGAAGNTVPALDEENAIVRNDGYGSANATTSGTTKPESLAGSSQGDPCGQVALWAAASTAPSSVRLGGGDRPPEAASHDDDSKSVHRSLSCVARTGQEQVSGDP